ncbi:MAG TPA: hypothetical protein VK164_12200 [Flavobacterium sp.]|uniref:hypothetical protein n=1 Tax=Flavobacterium sp. TaxID=239 RepID=UPI002B4B1AC8|nr:hypothetical protein [Flavobacterium sp.]HLO74692.1 hypothetical protein [Flavobacterium sp.]
MNEKKEKLNHLIRVRDLIDIRLETINNKELEEMILKNNSSISIYKTLTVKIKKLIAEIYG